MATYVELYDLRSNSALKNRIMVGCIIAAEAIRTEAPATANHANRLLWAKAVFADPDAEATRMMMALLAQFNANTVAQITGATDAGIQSAVNSAVDVFATGN